MLAEHEIGRRHIRAMVVELKRLQQSEPGAVAAIRSISEALCELLRGHILKEDNILFPMADGLIPDDVAQGLLEQFEAIERDRVGEGQHEAYHAMLNDLKNQYAVG